MTVKTPYEERAIKFITTILAPIYATAQNTNRYSKALREYNEKHKRPLNYEVGYTRVTVIRNDYVVKITYFHSEEIGDNQAEADNYEIAKKAGYEYLFAKPTLFEYMGMLFEIMPRVNHIGDYSRNYWNYLTDDELRFVEDNFDDLHEHNVGYYRNKPVFIDYSCKA